MIGTVLFLRISRQTSVPETFGNITSSNTASGRTESKTASASAPSRATSTRKPSRFRPTCKASINDSSSSTTKIVGNELFMLMLGLLNRQLNLERVLLTLEAIEL